MDKMSYPRGLIRYATQNAIDGKPSRVLRPRVFVYGALLLALCLAWAWGVGHRSTLIAEVLRDRTALYRVVDDNRVENGYTLKLVNKGVKPQQYRITVEAPQGIGLVGGTRTVDAPAEQVLNLPLTLSAPDDVHGKHEVTFKVEASDGSSRENVPSSFFGPMQ